MAVNFKELLGEKYTDEIAAVLGDLGDKLLVNDGSYIPKSRFDEVNIQAKASKTELEKIRISQLSDEEKLKEEKADLAKVKQEYKIKSNKIEVEKLFVQAKIAGYDKFLDRIVSEDLEASLAIAKDISDNYVSSLAAKDSEIEQLKLKNTPKPNGSDGQVKINKLNYTELSLLKTKDPAAYEAYMTQDSQE